MMFGDFAGELNARYGNAFGPEPRLLQTAANGSQPGTATVGSQQMLVNCGPYQRTLVRTTYLNGQPVSHVIDNVTPRGFSACSLADKSLANSTTVSTQRW